jgi:RNA polymerase sigma-70 factor (ECF subfamily)
MAAQQHPIDSEVTAIFLANQPALERYARSLTRDEDAAADISQEVFIRLLVVARAGRMPDVPAAWMHRVAHNIFVSTARRSNTTERTVEALSQAGHVRSTEDAAVERERDDLVRQALAGVRPFEREAMVLAAEGYRAAEIGDLLGRTAVATRTLLCRARGQLRMQLRQDFDAA